MAERKKCKITNKDQFKCLVEIMEKNQEIAKGQKFAEGQSISKQKYDEVWKNATSQLNSRGPPTRLIAEWQKVWTDFKLKVKKKLMHNKKEMESTGGWPRNLLHITPLEEAVIRILALDKAVICNGKEFSLNGKNLEQIPSTSKEASTEEDNEEDRESEIVPSSSSQKNTRKRKRIPVEKKSDLGFELLMCDGKEFGLNGKNLEQIPSTYKEASIEEDNEEDQESEILLNSNSQKNTRKRKRIHVENQSDLRFELLQQRTNNIDEIVKYLKDDVDYNKKMYIMKYREHQLKMEILRLKKRKLEAELNMLRNT